MRSTLNSICRESHHDSAIHGYEYSYPCIIFIKSFLGLRVTDWDKAIVTVADSGGDITCIIHQFVHDPVKIFMTMITDP